MRERGRKEARKEARSWEASAGNRRHFNVRWTGLVPLIPKHLYLFLFEEASAGLGARYPYGRGEGRRGLE